MANITPEERIKMLELLSDEMNTASVLEQECSREYEELRRERDLALAAYIAACRRVGDSKKRLDSSRVKLRLKRISHSSFCFCENESCSGRSTSRPLVPVEVPFISTPMTPMTPMTPPRGTKRALNEEEAVGSEAVGPCAKKIKVSEEDCEYFESDVFKNRLAELTELCKPENNQATECMYADLLAPSCKSSYLTYLISRQ